MAGMEIRGMDELLSMMEGLSKAASKKVQDKALLAAAQPILDDMVDNAPVRVVGSQDSRSKLKIGRPETKKGSRRVLIGLDKGDISEVFYLKFSEWGTTKQAAKPFIQPSKERNMGKVKDIMQEVLKGELGL